ncbi:hypothetical protein FCJ61_12510 [Burkholderia metallica]|uniref:hypothetical protein n=1 Tax=Burkholderia metallica TaxID=488729 RepID=UPI00157A7D23|nr:hypothetical protein [Burkholderia metallica]NTZ83800.1 hypothetical protein [Burkholderia metallica]
MTVWFDVPNRGKAADDVSYSTSFDLDPDHADRRSRALTRACREVASLLDTAFDVGEASDA